MEVQLQTPEDIDLERMWLQNPEFIATIDRGERLLVFFKEELTTFNPDGSRHCSIIVYKMHVIDSNVCNLRNNSYHQLHQLTLKHIFEIDFVKKRTSNLTQ